MIQTETARNEYTGNGSLKTYPFTFAIRQSSEIRVYLDAAIAVNDTDYTVGLTAQGGDIQFVVAPALDVKITFLRNVSATQLVDLNEGQVFDAEINEDEYDKLTMMVQQVREVISRALKFAPWSRKTNIDVPEPVTGKVLAWDASGALINQTGGADGRAFMWRGQWVSTTQYAVDDVVTSGGNTYIAIIANINSQPLSSNWNLMVQRGADGGSGGVTLGDTTPGDVASAGVAGTSTQVSRKDHVHAHPNTGSFLADAHHNKSHVHLSDGSGTVVHSSLGSVGIDDHHAKSHAHNGSDGSGTVAESSVTFTDITTGDASITKHGYMKKLPNDSALVYDGTGAFRAESGGGGGSGDVVGPSSAVADHLAVFNGTTGKLIKDGGVANLTNFKTSSFIRDDFRAGNLIQIGELDWVKAGASATFAYIAAELNHPGIMRVSVTSGTGTISLQADSALGNPGHSNRFQDTFDGYFVARNNATTNNSVRIGFYASAESSISTPPGNGIYFERLSTDDS